MLNALLPWRSLKTRVTIFTLMIFLIGVWSLAFYASLMLRQDMQRLLSNQQFSTVSILAAGLARELDGRFKALETVAGNLAPAMPGRPEAVQDLMDQRPVLQTLFNAGVMALDRDGVAIADVPCAAGRIGLNYMDMDSVGAALKQGKASVGRPHASRKSATPVFAMTVPVRDAEGRVIGALSGVTALGKPGFLDLLTESHDGKSSAYLLLASQSRLTVAASEPGRVMQALPAAGVNPSVDHFLQGDEGSAVISNADGVEVLSSVKGVPATDWLVAASLPTAEAFDPIRVMQRRVFLATLLLTLLAGALTWWMLRQQLSPMLAAARAMSAQSDSQLPPQPLPITSRDEIGDLIGGFNRLLNTLAQREVELRDNEERYHAFFQLSPDAVLVHRDNVIIFANDAAARLFHADSTATLIGRDWHQLIAPEDWAITEARTDALARGDATRMAPLERRYLTLAGARVTVESAGARIIFGGQPAVLSVIRDITERKHSEQQRLDYARQQRDTLVREVHHRIKNNLQSVAGLLQRELGKFVQLDPRLETAISQIDAIAAVHGLQSDDPDEAVRLCDSVRSICKTVSDLSQRPLRFHVAHEHSGFRPARIESRESVSVALVLNELILNAVKHSPQGSAAPSVTLSADGGSARLVIRNALANTPRFDIASDQGLGTGLRLVRSLLPEQGAKLTYERDAEGCMLTILTLTSPIVVKTPEQAQL